MIDKKKRRASWPAIENYFRRRVDHLVNKLNKTTMRRYYVERERPRGALYDPYKPDAYIKLSYFDKLILEPDATQDEWAQWFDPTLESARSRSKGTWLLDIQGGGNGIHLRKMRIHLTIRPTWGDNDLSHGYQTPSDACATVGCACFPGLAGLGGFHFPMGFLERRS